MTTYEGGTVLVVDNQEDVADLYATYLEDAGYDVRTAHNGGEAIMKLDEDVDVVLLDLLMPGMSGGDLLKAIREEYDWCRVAIVTSQDPDTEVVDLPFDEYLVKPVDETELLETAEQMFMLEEYDYLLDEYLSLTKRYATLRANRKDPKLQNDDRFQALKRERGEIRDRLAELITEFHDPEFTDAYRELHELAFEN